MHRSLHFCCVLEYIVEFFMKHSILCGSTVTFCVHIFQSQCRICLFQMLGSKINILPQFVFLCFQLRSGGSQILEGCIAEIPNISSLDISDNGEMLVIMLIVICIYSSQSRGVLQYNIYLLFSGLDSELSTLLVWLAKNRSIRHLSLGKNFNNIKSK